MDYSLIRTKVTGWIKRYRYVAIVLFAGIVLMLLPSGSAKADEPVPSDPKPQNTQLNVETERLEAVLCQIKGAGRVEVLLSFAAGERTVFQMDDRTSSAEGTATQERDTVLITNSDRIEEALVTQVLPPEYLGAVIVCQGADDPSVRLAISDAVSKATGLGSDRISVLKMK